MPSRLSSSAPGRATSAGTLRMTIGPIAIWSSSTSAASAAPLAVADRIVLNIEPAASDARAARIRGGQHDGGGAGVEQEGRACAVDACSDREFAAQAPVDDDFPASLDLRFRRKEFARDASDDIGSLEAIGVGARQGDQEERPGHRPCGEARNVARPR